jgi:hypothetical protein
MVVNIETDGTFEGSYYDSDMGVTGDGYESTCYVCNFRGKFTNIRKVDDYTYFMELATISVEDEIGTEWIENEIRFVASEPYGFESGKEFLIYLPGSTVSKLPEEFVNWIAMPLAWTRDDIPKVLPFYGLYNVSEGYGMFSSKTE